MTRRAWASRALMVALVAITTVAVLAGSDLHPDPVLVTVLAALVVFVGAVVLDALAREPSLWDVTRARRGPARGRDSQAAAHLRTLEDHLTARRPTSALRDRLARLADGVLDARHGVTRDSPAGRALLGEEVLAVLDGPARRLRLTAVERCVERIEAL